MKALEIYVAELCGCSVEDMTSRSRRAKITNARKICMSAMRDYTAATLEQIGGFFNRDHASAFYMISKARDHYKTEPGFRAVMDAVYDSIREHKLALPFPPPTEFEPSDEDVHRLMTEEELLILQLT